MTTKNGLSKIIMLPFKFSKKYSILLLASGLLYALFFNLSVYFLSITVDNLNMDNFKFLTIIPPLASYLLCMGFLFLITNLQNYYEQNFKAIAYINTKRNLYTKKFQMKYILNENAKILDTFSLLEDFDSDIIEYVKSLVFFLTLFFQLFFLFILISFYSINTTVIILIFTVIILILVIKGGNASYIAHKKVQPLERQKTQLENIMTNFSYAEERNLFEYDNYITKKYTAISNESRKYKNRSLLTWFVKAQYGGIVFIILTILVLLVLTSSLLKNELSFGLFVAILSNFIQLSDLMSWNLSDNVDSFIKSIEKIKDYFYLIDLENEKNDSTAKSFNELQCLNFENVTFRYPDTLKSVLSNISFSFEKGKKYAIVGENGCGKTTILKLLLGLYTDYNGNIYYNDNKNNTLSRNILTNNICVVFQDFSKYYIPINDFINLGANRTIADIEILEIFNLLELNLDTNTFPQGLSTPLGNIFDEGTNISGGQWQKLCLTRALLSGKSYIILDEPTASIDPISELKIINTFNNLCKDKTIIHITHRLATIKEYDSIYVIENGKIVENGSHIQLIEKHGLYYTMFETQKSWYKNETGDLT